MKAFKQKDFILTFKNDNSPIIITVPHGGMKNSYGLWLDTFFEKRVKSAIQEENFIQGERIVVGGDNQIMHVVGDMLKNHQTNVIIGLLPRIFVDYNRFVPEVAYVDKKIEPFYQAYHVAISETIERLKKKWKTIYLFDFHGFGTQPIDGTEFDIILGTNNESAPNGSDKIFYSSLKNRYRIFCSGVDNMPPESDLYKGNTTNLYYHKKFDIDAVLVEISPKFRSSEIADSRIHGTELAKDLATFFNTLRDRTS